MKPIANSQKYQLYNLFSSGVFSLFFGGGEEKGDLNCLCLCTVMYISVFLSVCLPICVQV